MPIDVRGTTQDSKLLRTALEDVRRLIETSNKIPEDKRRELLRVLDDPDWSIRVDLPVGGELRGVTSKVDKSIRISLGTFAGGINRFRAVIFHELVHASCEGEFDAEVFECLLFPPDENATGGGTWPRGDDFDPFTNGTSSGDGGLRESDHFFWDPVTGIIWRKNPDGSVGPIVWEHPDIWDKWRTPKSLALGPAVDTSQETFVDYVEPGEYGYRALEEPVRRPPVETVLERLQFEEQGAASGFVDFIGVDVALPLSIRAQFVAKVLPDADSPETTTRIRLKDGDEFRVKGRYADVMNKLR